MMVNNLFIFVITCMLPIVLSMKSVEQWNVYEFKLSGPSNGNPFIDVQLSANFSLQSTPNDAFVVTGFYDGNGVYKIRFMPNKIGIWTYKTSCNIKSMNNISDSFNATTPSQFNYGPAYANPADNKSFIWANGNLYFSVGTTTYVWHLFPGMDVQNTTISTLKYTAENNIFNKIRMAVFPFIMYYTHYEPPYYPYVGTPPNKWDFTMFNVSFWQHLDWALTELLNIPGMIVDLILFHPYDHGHWGFDCMGGTDPLHYNLTNDELYLKYIISRVASYRNVWWSMGNEYDQVKCKNKSLPNAFPIWDQLFKTLIKYDPYHDPVKEKSIHQNSLMYNYSQPWTTHFSVQNYEQTEYKWFNNKYNVLKPVILDEVRYEGNSTKGQPWEDITAIVETDRFWTGVTNGVHVGHSDAMLKNLTDDTDGNTIMWWSYGYKLLGQSPPKIGFFNKYMMDKKRHPLFNELDNVCLLYNNDNADSGVCLIMQLYKAGVFYLFHWTEWETSCYMPTINVKLPNNGVIYQVSYVDFFFGTTVTTMNNITSGSDFVFTPPAIPYNIELINIEYLKHD